MNKQTKQLMKENNDLSFHLKAADNKILTDMVVYIRGADISGYQQELVRRDITQMILDGEQRGDTMEDIIGSDYKIFCDNVLREVPHHTRAEKAVSFLGTLCVALAVLLAVRLLFGLSDIFGDTHTWPYIPVTTGAIISMVILLCSVLLLYNTITRNSFNISSQNNKRISVLFAAIILACICADFFLKTVILSVHISIVLIAILLLLIIYKITDTIN